MSLSGIQEKDIVMIAGAHYKVLGKERGRLFVNSIGSHSPRWVRATEVEAHWRKRR